MTKVDERVVVPVIDPARRKALSAALDRENVVAAYLFGSQATARVGALSDVDVAVWVEPTRDPETRWTLRADLLRSATEALGTEAVDLVLLNEAPPLLAHAVMRDGVLLLERDPRERVRLETAAMIDYLDTGWLRGTQAAARRRRLEENRFGRR